MTETAETATPRALAVKRGESWRVEKRDLVLFAAATVAAWAHTIDEMRIGEFIAVPFGLLNAAVVAAWPRLRLGWRAAMAIAFGLFWALAVVPYHVIPLLQGAVTGQHVSGLSRVAGGAAMVALGFAILRRRGTDASDAEPR